MTKLKTNDNVIVIAGKDKGKQGNVLKILKGEKALVEGINKIKKHEKQNPQKGIAGGIVEKEKAIHISNIAIYNAQTGKPDKIKYLINEAGSKSRVYASNNELIDL